MQRRGFLMPRLVSPAGEVHLIAPQVNIAIREHSADLLKELGHEGICRVQDGVHWSKASRRLRSRVTGREQIFLAWQRTRVESMLSEIRHHFDDVKSTFSPRLSVSGCVKLCDNTNAPQTGKFNHHLHIRRCVHMCVWVECSLSSCEEHHCKTNNKNRFLWQLKTVEHKEIKDKTKHPPAGSAGGMFCSGKERMVHPQCASGTRLFCSLPWFPV